MKRSFPICAWLAVIVLWTGAALLLVLGYGCAGRRPPLSNATGESIVRAQIRGESALGHVNAAKPDTTPRGLVHLDTASGELTAQEKDLTDARKALDVERKNANATQDAYERLNSRWYVKLGKLITGSLWVLGGVLAAGFALRVASMFVTGPAGGVLAGISTGIFGVLSGGVSLIQATFDNIFFRKVAPARAAPGAPS